MARYIDADKIPFYLENEGNTTIEYAYKNDIDAVPTADVLPVVHGKWSKDMVAVKETAPGYHSDDVRFGFQCSRCGEISNYKTPYCGCCAAKMVLENPICSNARIVNTGTLEKPYYQIEYKDNNDGTLRLGYGTKDLDIAIHWLSRYFDSGTKKDRKDNNETR